MCDKKSWPYGAPKWDSQLVQLMDKHDENSVKPVKLDEIIGCSREFNNVNQFPIISVTCSDLKTRVPKGVLERNINSVYPVIHESSLFLYAQFILFKRKNGTDIEKNIYKNMCLTEFVDRLLRKRAVVFVDVGDSYQLIDGKTGSGRWTTIGNDEHNLFMKDCLSYDEIKLSALLSVSSYTHFMNIGNRHNIGIYELNRTKVQEEGIIIGLIGARFEKANVMEYQEVIVTKNQNTYENGYGMQSNTMPYLMMNFYEEPCLTFDESKNNFKDKIKFTELNNNAYFNNVLYAKRLALSIDVLLIEANHRAKLKNTFAYVHVVGLGLGVWKISVHQEKLFMNIFAERIEFLGSRLKNISDLCFSYIKSFTCGKYKDEEIIPIEGHTLKGIKVNIFNREPHEKLTGRNNKLLVVSYAWDGNALPGNEFWWKQLSASGDPAAAASSQISEIHNPHINPLVSGANLHVATLNGIETFTEYKKKFSEQH